MLLNDREIARLARKGMITPYVASQTGRISYGQSSFGYDIRLADEFVSYASRGYGEVDPLNIKDASPITSKMIDHDFFLIPPHGFVLAHSVEVIDVPEDVLVVCLGKSTYARCGLIVNVTPLEPGWKGQITLEISNTTDLPARVYINEGICQLLFFRGEHPQISYHGRKGRYMDQTGVTLPKGIRSDG